YRAKSNHLSESQWEALLRSTLLQEHTPDQQDPDINDLETVASISDSKLTITFRKSISGIHQKLGELSLNKDADAAINLLDWANTAILRAEGLETEAQILKRKLAEQMNFAQKLNRHLEDLIQAKKEHEDTLLAKCALLINEKKCKIRDQQRLLATANVDPKKLRAVQAARRPGPPSQKPGPSAKSKRKASALASPDDDGDGFEDKGIKVEDVDEEQQPDSEDVVTPEHSDLDETEDEVDSTDLDAVPVPSTGKGKLIETSEVARPANKSGASDRAQDVDLPPRRELPFMKDKTGSGQGMNHLNKDPDTQMADDDETDDDEL
ncbi:MAG: hypothetical protein Q9221_007888, partial [Calogaya cf. arnoldii]